MGLFKSSENKRIEFLVHCYLKVIREGQSDDTAKLLVCWEYTPRNERLFERLSDKDISEQWKIINSVLGVSKDVRTDDIISLISRIVSMESPTDEELSIEKMRSGTDRLSKLNAKTAKIYNKMK